MKIIHRHPLDECLNFAFLEYIAILFMTKNLDSKNEFKIMADEMLNKHMVVCDEIYEKLKAYVSDINQLGTWSRLFFLLKKNE